MSNVRSMLPSQNPDPVRSAFFDLEDQVHDLDRLSEIAETLVCEWVDATGSELPRASELATCMVQVLRDKARLFKEGYLRAFTAGRDGR